MALKVNFPPHDQVLAQLKELKICEYLSYMFNHSYESLDGIAYTDNQAEDLAKALIQGLTHL